ncbi:MAG: hypothetical protein ACM3MK_00710 [Chitinophagales bacterium]
MARGLCTFLAGTCLRQPVAKGITGKAIPNCGGLNDCQQGSFYSPNARQLLSFPAHRAVLSVEVRTDQYRPPPAIALAREPCAGVGWLNF